MLDESGIWLWGSFFSCAITITSADDDDYHDGDDDDNLFKSLFLSLKNSKILIICM